MMRSFGCREERKLLLRIVDANLNRVSEGLRVAEDVVRFVYNKSQMTARLKRLRHECSKLGLRFPASYRQLVGARDSEKDVGKASWVRFKKRQCVCEVLVQNLKRAAEGLRVLEETSKVITPKLSPRFQKLRFDVYGLEKEVFKGL